MDLGSKLVGSIAMLVGLVILAALLRRAGLLKDEHGSLFATLVTHVTLPALIFGSLARRKLEWHYAELAVVMLGAELACLGLAWLVGQRMRLPRPQLGALLLTSAFGSSAFLGYALIAEMFPGNVPAMSEAVLVSELGVGPTLFVLGVAVASHYGRHSSDGPGHGKAALSFFWSPIFAALVAGGFCSAIDLPRDNPVIQVVFQGLDVVAQANTFLVTLTLGVLLRVEHFGSYGRLLVIAGAIKLLIEPVLVWLPTLVTSLSPVGLTC